MFDYFKAGLNANCMSASDWRGKEFSAAIKRMLRGLYTTPLRPKLRARAQYENEIVKSTQWILKRSNIVPRRTDKSKVFHLGSAHDYHRKAVGYMEKTNAYQEIVNGINPCMDHLRRVLALVDPLLQKRAINFTKWKREMRPNANTVELAHLYFIPKPHKVQFFDRSILIYSFLFIHRLTHLYDRLFPRFMQQPVVFHTS